MKSLVFVTLVILLVSSETHGKICTGITIVPAPSVESPPGENPPEEYPHPSAEPAPIPDCPPDFPADPPNGGKTYGSGCTTFTPAAQLDCGWSESKHTQWSKQIQSTSDANGQHTTCTWLEEGCCK